MHARISRVVVAEGVLLCWETFIKADSQFFHKARNIMSCFSVWSLYMLLLPYIMHTYSVQDFREHLLSECMHYFNLTTHIVTQMLLNIHEKNSAKKKEHAESKNELLSLFTFSLCKKVILRTGVCVHSNRKDMTMPTSRLQL